MSESSSICVFPKYILKLISIDLFNNLSFVNMFKIYYTQKDQGSFAILNFPKTCQQLRM